MELRQLRHFSVLAETLNFSEAAGRLHIAQPALSVSIQKLEAEIGARLFHRKTREVRLTEQGRVALSYARQAIANAEELRRSARSFAAGEVGRLRIGFVTSATYRLFPQRLPEFRRRFQRVELELYEGNTQQTLSLVDSGRLDVGIVRYPLLAKRAYLPITSEADKLVAVMQPDHPLARKAALRIADLKGEQMILFSAKDVTSLNSLIMLACERAGFVPNVSQEAIHFQTIVSLVRSGFGIGIVPAVCQLAYGDALAFRPISGAGRSLDVGLGIVRAEGASTPLATHFIDALSAPDAA